MLDAITWSVTPTVRNRNKPLNQNTDSARGTNFRPGANGGSAGHACGGGMDTGPAYAIPPSRPPARGAAAAPDGRAAGASSSSSRP
jgi:hypothetical protein